MPAESIAEQLAETLRALLAGINGGADYWYDLTDPTKARVVRTTFFDEATDLDETLEHILLIRPGDEIVAENATGDATTGGELASGMEVFVLIARRFSPATEAPFTEQAPGRWTVANRAIRDVLRKLFFGPGVQLSGQAVNIVKDGLEIDRARFVEGWALAEMRFVIDYRFMAATP